MDTRFPRLSRVVGAGGCAIAVADALSEKGCTENEEVGGRKTVLSVLESSATYARGARP